MRRLIIIFICASLLGMSGCAAGRWLTDSTSEEQKQEIVDAAIKAERAAEKAIELAEKSGNETAIEAANKALEVARKAKQEAQDIVPGDPRWVSILSGVGSIAAALLAARGLPGAGGVLLRLTENPANRRKVAKEVQARDKWVDEVE